MRATCVCPEGYRPAADVLMFAHKYGEKFHLLTDPAEGVKDADAVLTAAWNTAPGTPESERRLRDFAGFQVSSRLMDRHRSTLPPPITIHIREDTAAGEPTISTRLRV